MVAGDLPDEQDDICLICICAVADDRAAADDVAERLRENGSMLDRAAICHDARGLICPFGDTDGLCDLGKRGLAYNLLKRAIDMLGGLVGSIGVLVMLPLIALIIKIQSPGPIFFTQRRVGLDGKHFSLLKFRTMHERSTGEARWANEEEERIFGFGAIMRRFHIDEFPQFLSVLVGDMSLVGPRPEQVPIVERLREKIPNYDNRHRALPGITGWSQVRHGYAGCEFSSWIKTASDLYYVKHRTILLDISVLLNTLPTVLFKERKNGVHQPEEQSVGADG